MGYSSHLSLRRTGPSPRILCRCDSFERLGFYLIHIIACNCYLYLLKCHSCGRFKNELSLCTSLYALPADKRIRTGNDAVLISPGSVSVKRESGLKKLGQLLCDIGYCDSKWVYLWF